MNLVRSDIDIYRGNQWYDGTLRTPLVIAHTQEIPQGGGILGVNAVRDNLVLVGRGGYLMCVDAKSKSILWEYDESSVAGIPTIYDSNGLFLTLNRNTLTAVEFATGSHLWKQESFGVLALSSKYVIADDYRSATATLTCFDRRDGEFKWNYADLFGSGPIAIEKGKVVAKDSTALHIIDEHTGKLTWKIIYSDFLAKHYPERLAKWKKRPGGGGQLAPTIPDTRLGGIVDGTIYISWEIGIVAAIDVHNGELKWSWCFPEGRDLNLARSIIHYNGNIYLHDAQGRGSLSYLYSVNASNGETVFYTKDKVTPRGCAHSAIVGKYFIGASVNALAVWDLEKQERVWVYEHKKGDIFDVPFAITTTGIIASDPDRFRLHWLECSLGNARFSLISK